MRTICPLCLLATLSITVFAACAITQAIPPQTSLYNSTAFPSTNSTLSASSGNLTPLTIPSINETETWTLPTLPPFDPSKVTPANMTQVRTKMETNPISDINHFGPMPPR